MHHASVAHEIARLGVLSAPLEKERLAPHVRRAMLSPLPSVLRRALAIAATLFTLLMPRVASAVPYKIFLQYRPTTNNLTADEKKDAAPIKVDIPISEDGTTVPVNDLLPRNTVDLIFDGVFMQLNKNAKDELSHVDSFDVDFFCSSSECQNTGKAFAYKKISASDFEARLIVPDAALTQEAKFEQVVIQVQAKFNAGFLCAHELQLRAGKGPIKFLTPPKAPAGGTPAAPAKPAPSPPPDAPKGDKVPVHQDASWAAKAIVQAVVSEQGLVTAEGTPILYSFCHGISKVIDYAALAADLRDPVNASRPKTAKALHDFEKKLLMEYMKKTLGAGTALGEIQIDEDGDKIDSETTYAHRAIHVGFVNNVASQLEITENGRTERFADGVVHQGSTIRVVPRTNATVYTKMLEKMKAYVDYDDPEKNHVHARVDFGKDWSFKRDLHDLLNRKVTFTLSYPIGQKETVVAIVGPVYVRNLGIVTSVPVVSEVVTAITKKDSKLADLAGQSSIPLSIAVPWNGDAARAAVTFPWMFSYNSEKLPTLADYFSVFVGVSAIAPVSSEAGKIEAGFGGGLSFFRALAFSVATTVGDHPRGFVLIGLSVPDLVKALQK